MAEIIAENPSFASPKPHSALLEIQIQEVMAEAAAVPTKDLEIPSIQTRRGLLGAREVVDALLQTRGLRLRTVRRPTARRTRIRARRSPASTRRATADSGGDRGREPEPPRPSRRPRTGGAL